MSSLTDLKSILEHKLIRRSDLSEILLQDGRENDPDLMTQHNNIDKEIDIVKADIENFKPNKIEKDVIWYD